MNGDAMLILVVFACCLLFIGEPDLYDLILEKYFDYKAGNGK